MDLSEFNFDQDSPFRWLTVPELMKAAEPFFEANPSGRLFNNLDFLYAVAFLRYHPAGNAEIVGDVYKHFPLETARLMAALEEWRALPPERWEWRDIFLRFSISQSPGIEEILRTGDSTIEIQKLTAKDVAEQFRAINEFNAKEDKNAGAIRISFDHRAMKVAYVEFKKELEAVRIKLSSVSK